MHTVLQVMKLTPLPDISGHACVWTDAIYAAMQLQTLPAEDTINIREKYFEYKALLEEEEEEEKNGDGGGGDGGDIEVGAGEQRASMNVDYHKVAVVHVYECGVCILSHLVVFIPLLSVFATVAAAAA